MSIFELRHGQYMIILVIAEGFVAGSRRNALREDPWDGSE